MSSCCSLKRVTALMEVRSLFRSVASSSCIQWSGQRLPSVILMFVLLVFDWVIPNVSSACVCVRLNTAVPKVTQHGLFIKRIASVFAKRLLASQNGIPAQNRWNTGREFFRRVVICTIYGKLIRRGTAILIGTFIGSRLRRSAKTRRCRNWFDTASPRSKQWISIVRTRLPFHSYRWLLTSSKISSSIQWRLCRQCRCT